MRRFGDAVRDLSKAWRLAQGTEDAIEPDGAPNELGVPRSSTHSNVLYHLALAQVQKGDSVAARQNLALALEMDSFPEVQAAKAELARLESN